MLLVQIGPLLDADDRVPVPDDIADVVQGRADPVVKITVVPF